jgi:DNA-binding response OmpR family regulator
MPDGSVRPLDAPVFTIVAASPRIRHDVGIEETCVPSILIVDDERDLLSLVEFNLKQAGFETALAETGEGAVKELRRKVPDLVLLDLMLPKLDGYEVFRRIRDHGGTPVIMLTARGDETDRIVGLDLGADDYVTKPFSPREVVARVRAVLRRTSDLPNGEPLRYGDLEIDGERREARLRGAPVRLTRKEFDLLHHLASRPGVALTRTQLLEEVWDFAWDGDSATVTVHVRRLREKIEEDPSEPTRIVTVWGVGYRFEA